MRYWWKVGAFCLALCAGMFNCYVLYEYGFYRICKEVKKLDLFVQYYYICKKLSLVYVSKNEISMKCMSIDIWRGMQKFDLLNEVLKIEDINSYTCWSSSTSITILLEPESYDVVIWTLTASSSLYRHQFLLVFSYLCFWS